MKVLGIHDGHTATACLLIDGTIAGMASEERFNRLKCHGGEPLAAVRWLLDLCQLAPEDIDAVAFVGHIAPIKDIGAYRQGRHHWFSALSRILPGPLLRSRTLAAAYLAWQHRERSKLRGCSGLLQLLDRTAAQVSFVDHHRAHAASAYFASGFQDKGGDTLVVTCDGSGDGLCASVSVGRGYGLTRLASIASYDSIGIMYSRITQLLGMKPLEHEYKVMGLAPYADDRSTDQAYAILARLFSLSPDRLRFVNRSRAWGASTLRRLHRELFCIRFDAIAGAVQRLHEELLIAFVVAWVRKTGIARVAVGGGSFMNVKCNGRLLSNPEIDELFVLPSCGDESTALGAAYEAALTEQRIRSRPAHIAALGPLYLGSKLSHEEILAALARHGSEIQYRHLDCIETETARLIAQGKIVGRVRGAMEWGARALGNRSILAAADSLNTVRKINAAIKMRDFWMPFAPSILWERRHDYIVNPRDADSHYMILAFESTPLAQKELIAGLHPFDLTCRPQLVRKEHNPQYHKLLCEYQTITGVGGILNTSFNLHGDPIVRTAEDGIYTLLGSDLDYLTLEDYLVWRAEPRQL